MPRRARRRRGARSSPGRKGRGAGRFAPGTQASAAAGREEAEREDDVGGARVGAEFDEFVSSWTVGGDFSSPLGPEHAPSAQVDAKYMCICIYTYMGIHV